MTRRPSSGGGAGNGAGKRVTPPAEPVERELPSLRQRQPIVFWGSLIGVGAMVVATFGSFLSAFL